MQTPRCGGKVRVGEGFSAHMLRLLARDGLLRRRAGRARLRHDRAHANTVSAKAG